MAQLIYHEGGTIFDSDLNAVGAYFNDLWGIGSGILNLWETDRQILVVYLPNGQVAYPLGTPLSRSLKDVIIAIARDKLGALFDAAGNMRQPDRANIDRVLNTDTASLPLVTNGTGNPMNRGCQGVLSSIGVASDLLNGAPRYSPGGFALLFWNREPPNSTTSSLGSQGYEGIRSDREQGHTFWGLPTVRPPVPKPIRRPPGINAPIRGSEGRAGGSSR